MKKILYFCVAAAGMTIMLSCGGKGGQQRVASDEQDTSAVNVIPTDNKRNTPNPRIRTAAPRGVNFLCSFWKKPDLASCASRFLVAGNKI